MTPSQVPDARIREYSRLVFGNRYALEVYTAIARTDGDFYVRELARRLGIADNLVKPVVERLEQADLLKRMPRQRPSDPVYFASSDDDDPLWEFSVSLYERHAGD